ncbi:MAG: hypothetical protein JWP12_1779 [Bacteroidetes bacterium]|nr:hypothetical protein [Bacteroidota bacterium]
MLKALKNKYELRNSQVNGFVVMLVVVVSGFLYETQKAINSSRKEELLSGPGKYAIGLTINYTGDEIERVMYVFTVNGKPYYGATMAQEHLWIDRFVRVPGGYYKVKYYPADPTLNTMNFDTEIHIKTKKQN